MDSPTSAPALAPSPGETEWGRPTTVDARLSCYPRCMRRVAVLLVLMVGGACKDEAPTPPPRKVKKKVDTDRIPAPNHSPEMLKDPGKPRRVTMKGSMEADLSGRRQHFGFFPRGNNAAVHAPETGVSWLKLEGALSDEGTPSLSFTLDPLELDEVKLPATFVAGQSKDGQPKLTVEYEMGPTERWSSEEESEKPMRITLESFEGRRLSGTFEGILPAQAPNQSDPVKIDKGTFSIEVRLTNIERGGSASEKPAEPE